MGIEVEGSGRVFEGERPIEGELNPDKLIAEGWVYKDLPWMTAEALDLFLSILGRNNYIGLAVSIRPGTGEKRGQILINPDGLANLRGYAGARPS